MWTKPVIIESGAQSSSSPTSIAASLEPVASDCLSTATRDFDKIPVAATAGKRQSSTHDVQPTTAKRICCTEGSEEVDPVSAAVSASDIQSSAPLKVDEVNGVVIEGSSLTAAAANIIGHQQNDENTLVRAMSNVISAPAATKRSAPLGGHSTSPAAASTANGLDSDLYSRQIGAFGLETMSRLVKMNVLISGLRGAGIETAKNLILAGPAKVTLHDDTPVEMRDLATNFYATPEDVKEGRTRADACFGELAALNDYVAVNVIKGPLDDVLAEYDVAVFSNTSKSLLAKYNKICRSAQHPTGFIVADAFGLCCSIFVDFGDKFTIYDKSGEPPRHAIVAGVTHENPGSVHVHSDKPLPFDDGDYVSFRELSGMTELNGSPPRPIKISGKHSFTIEDTTGYTPYTRDGIVYQVKVPDVFHFGSFEERCVMPLVDGQSLPMPDLGKFGRSEQLFFAVQALLEYQDSLDGKLLPRCRDEEAVKKCCQIAKTLNETAKTQALPNCVSVDEIDEEVIANVVKFADASICPIASFVGGVAAQEVVKYTGKYTPIRQWLFLDAFEMIPAHDPNDCVLKVPSRYDDQISLWGHEFQKKLGSLKIFLVGAGALGCELLKQLALMGYCALDGLLTVTDMDSIETSNLNRQFLFRRQHVGKSKSLIAGQVVQQMNPDFRVRTLTDRVGPETEEQFNDEFWTGLDLVINALDNVPSRIYVDGRCVWYGKPLMESGTLGTKGNVQVVLPRMTESYSDSQDPPEESIPLCTLKHFPHEIEHTIEWARDSFQGLFCDRPQQAVTFLKNPSAYIARLENEGPVPLQRERLQMIRDLMKLRSDVQRHPSEAYAHCVQNALEVFHDYFFIQISQLLFNFPTDHVTSDGQPFWSGPKRPPTAIRFDPNDNLHVAFVQSAANLIAFSLGVQMSTDPAAVVEVAKKLSLPDFTPRQVRIKVDESDTSTVEGAGDDDSALQRLKEDLPSFVGSDTASASIVPAEFEKDDDSNFHIDFIWTCANLRARNYNITECDRHKAKMIAGKIIPAIATTTGMVTGLVGIEAIKVLDYDKRKIEDFKNSFVNMSLSFFILSEPMGPAKTVDKDHDPIACGPVRVWPSKGFTTWDKMEIASPAGTLEQMLSQVEKMANVEVAIVSVGNTCLYNSFLPTHKERLKQPIKELYERVSKTVLPSGRNYLACEVSCSSKDDDVDILVPLIKFIFA